MAADCSSKGNFLNVGGFVVTMCNTYRVTAHTVNCVLLLDGANILHKCSIAR